MAASGMCDAGRIRKHLKRLLWRRDTTVLLTGFQVQGTLGRLLADGATRVRIQGEDIRVAARVRSLDTYSGHADANALAAWALARRPVGGSVFLCHGEPSASEGLAARLAAAGFAPASLVRPTLDQAFILDATSARSATGETMRVAPATPTALDWHNMRAAFLGELDAALEGATTDAARASLIAALRRDVAAETPAQRPR
jgi:metallo-beta-lactamase family protein